MHAFKVKKVALYAKKTSLDIKKLVPADQKVAHKKL